VQAAAVPSSTIGRERPTRDKSQHSRHALDTAGRRSGLADWSSPATSWSARTGWRSRLSGRIWWRWSPQPVGDAQKRMGQLEAFMTQWRCIEVGWPPALACSSGVLRARCSRSHQPAILPSCQVRLRACWAPSSEV